MPEKLTGQSAATNGSAEWPVRLAACGAWLAAVALVLFGEFLGFGEEGFVRPNANPIDWLLSADADLLIYLGLLALAPLVWSLRDRIAVSAPASVRAKPDRALTKQSWLATMLALFADRPQGSTARALVFSGLVAAVSLGASAYVGHRFGDLPPAYHDEYSYLFQAKTFLAGRVSYPSHAVAQLFDQLHVLNEGRFASRYFPGTGLWMAPFVAIGQPWYGHWLAGALSAAIFFWCGRELASDAVGLVAGLLIALSPGQAFFSNILVAHHPTLVGLSLFLLGFLRMTRGGGPGWALACGGGLCFSALCRPMTAAGVALPFGIYLAWWALRPELPPSAQAPPYIGRAARIGRIGLLALPLVMGGSLLFFYNREITGNGWQTPYSAYTDIYTPRHVYGFHNVERGEQRAGPRVIESYDRWAKNLTAKLAVENARRRWFASWTWTLGIIPLGFSFVAGLFFWGTFSAGARLILLGILSLHAAHVPYWFAGMEDHHYVFESGVLWCLWCALTTGEMLRRWQIERRTKVAVWWIALLASAVAMNWHTSGGKWSAPIEQGINRLGYPRQLYARFAQRVATEVRPRPALVLVDADPADVHINYVVNDPDLKGEVLFGRYLPEEIPLGVVRRLFPERKLFLYRAREARFERP